MFRFIVATVILFCATTYGQSATNFTPMVIQDSDPFMVKVLRSNMNINDAVYIKTGQDNPSVTAVNAPKGSLYLRTGSSGGQLYVKQDDGLTTNWTLGGGGGGGLDPLNIASNLLPETTNTYSVGISGKSWKDANIFKLNDGDGGLSIYVDARELSDGATTQLKWVGGLKLGAAQLIFPSADGTAGQGIVTDGAGNLSFGSAAPDFSNITQDLVFGFAGTLKTTNGSSATNNLFIQSGDTTGNSNTGNITITSGANPNATGNSRHTGNVVLQSSGGPKNTGTVIITSGTSGRVPGGVAIAGGDTQLAGGTGAVVNITSGGATAGGTSGQINLTTANADDTGSINIITGNGTASSGTVAFFAGDAPTRGTFDVNAAAARLMYNPGSATVTPLLFFDASGTNAVGFQAPASSGNVVWNLPAGDGALGDCLKTDGSANLSFSACSGGGGLSTDMSNMANPVAMSQNLIWGTGIAGTLQTQDSAVDSYATNDLTIKTGDSTGNFGPISGNLHIASGTSNGQSGDVTFESGPAANTNVSGALRFKSGTVSAGVSSGSIFFTTSPVSANVSQSSGSYNFSTGAGTGALTGGYTFLTGASDIDTGGFQFGSGNSSTGNSGGMVYSTGNGANSSGGFLFSTGISGAGNSGDFTVNIGSAAGTRGSISLDGHIVSASSAGSPVVSACGTSPAIVGSDVVGEVTVGTTAGSTCTLTFVQAFANPPVCVPTDETTASVIKAPATTTTVTFSGTFADGDVIGYHCLAR